MREHFGECRVVDSFVNKSTEEKGSRTEGRGRVVSIFEENSIPKPGRV